MAWSLVEQTDGWYWEVFHSAYGASTGSAPSFTEALGHMMASEAELCQDAEPFSEGSIVLTPELINALIDCVGKNIYPLEPDGFRTFLTER